MKVLLITSLPKELQVYIRLHHTGKLMGNSKTWNLGVNMWFFEVPFFVGFAYGSKHTLKFIVEYLFQMLRREEKNTSDALLSIVACSIELLLLFRMWTNWGSISMPDEEFLRQDCEKCEHMYIHTKRLKNWKSKKSW